MDSQPEPGYLYGEVLLQPASQPVSQYVSCWKQWSPLLWLAWPALQLRVSQAAKE